MQAFNALTMPLAGRRLVEAGAGTGKTWALSLLVVRMVLGDAEPGEPGESAGIEQILALTYTRAATAELKTRIRARLLLARRLLEGVVRAGHAEYDEALAAVLSRVTPDHAAHDLAAQRLETALRRMDEAAITTIHGFCQRLVQEHALEAGLPLDLEALPDEAALREEVAADFWRGRFYPAAEGETRLAADHWAGPAALLAAVTPTLNLDDGRVLPPPAPDAVSAACAELRERLPKLREMWAAEREAIMALLAGDKCLSRSKDAYRQDNLDALPGTLAELWASPDFPRPLPKRLELLDAAFIEGHILKKCQAGPSHPFFDAFGEFRQIHQTMLADWKTATLHEARTFIKQELARRKRERGLIGYDDMLALAARALTDPQTGPGLAAALRRRYRAVFVDEFQDSDPAQYRIFDAVAAAPGFPLIMIGDPKQAIYAFRGGDIFTYLRARADCPEDARHTMTTNQRAAPGMVAAVNEIFDRNDPFLSPDILFQPAEAAGRVKDGGCLIDGAPPAPLNVFLLTRADEAELALGQADERAAAVCAGAIKQLLAPGRAMIEDRPLSGGDIAVLAANHRQAELMRQALSGLGLASVYMGRVSVFASAEAAETECLLRALLNPQDRGLRAEALDTALFGLGVAELAAEGPEAARLTQSMRELAAHWRREGVGPMLHRLFRSRRLAARLSALPDGERRLTNFLHLAELLDEEEERAPGRERLLRRLERLRREAGEAEAAEEQLLRLESDRHLIRIGTLHGAKGLEYPLVFLPFLCRPREIKKRGCVICHDGEGRALADFAPSLERRERAEEEDRAEAARLLYVALTRAKYANFVCWGRAKDMDKTPLARLLHGERAEAVVKDEAALRDDLAALNENGPLVRILPPDESPWPEDAAEAEEEKAAPLSVRKFAGEIPQGLGTCSFTGIVSGREPAGDMGEKGEDDPAAPPPASPRNAELFADIADFPRGANPGSCLHRMLELLDFTRPAAEQADLAAAQLEAHGLDTAWTRALLPWLDGVLNTELPGSRALAGLPPGDRVSELRFHFPFKDLDFARLDRLLLASGLPALNAGADTPKLAERLMTGSIDLVFRHGERFFIVDYKSNHLGPDTAAYDAAALAGAMARHHYHLQYLIYSVALRRHLRARGRDPEGEFGGVYYLFARGMRPGASTGIFYDKPSPALLRGFEDILGDGEAGHAG